MPVKERPPLRLQLCEHVGSSRAQPEQFIRERFAGCFGAQVTAFMPRLFSLKNEADEVCGAFGLRSATHSLFLEQYMDLPIEAAVRAHCGLPVARRQIVEVGQFSGAFAGSVRMMIMLLTERLHAEGAAWVVFTGTAPLRNAFTRMGLRPVDLCAADPARLPRGEQGAWGSYYEHQPRVAVGDIAQGHAALQASRQAAQQPGAAA